MNISLAEIISLGRIVDCRHGFFTVQNLVSAGPTESTEFIRQPIGEYLVGDPASNKKITGEHAELSC